MFSAITRNITTLNLLHTKFSIYVVFRNVRNFIHENFYVYDIDVPIISAICNMVWRHVYTPAVPVVCVRFNKMADVRVYDVTACSNST